MPDKPTYEELEQKLKAFEKDAIEGHELNVDGDLYGMLFEHDGFGIALVEKETGRRVAFNKKLHKRLGYTREEYENLTIADIQHDQGLGPKEAARRMEMIFEKGSLIFEEKQRTKSGEPRYVLVSAIPMRIHGKDFVHAISIDITDRKKVEGALKESEERFRTERKKAQAVQEQLTAAMDQAAEGIAVIETSGVIRYTNHAMAGFFGGNPTNIIGLNVNKPAEDPVAERLFEIIRKSVHTQEGWSGRVTAKQDDQKNIILAGTISPVLNDAGSITAFSVIFNDVTRLSEMELQIQQSQKLESIGHLAGGVAHDFNNLLSPIIGYAELALGELPESHPLTRNINEIISAGKRAAGLTRQLLAFSRKQMLSLKKLNINEEIRDLLKMLGRLIGEDIQVHMSLAPELGIIHADPVQIQQIIMNLAVNSRDAMPKGGKLTIETANEILDEEYARTNTWAQPGDYVMLKIKDTGCGMSPEVQEYIFEPFFTTKESDKGTGLGLSTVYGIVKQHGGYIDIKSEPGQGTTFKIFFPMMEGIASLDEQPATVGLSVDSDITVLVAEDDNGVRQLVSQILESRGYNVLSASGPKDAMDMANKHHEAIDLLITDVVMPHMDGHELAQRLAEIISGLKVLFMSGYTRDIIAQKGVIERGINLIQKPFTVNELLKKVQLILNT